MLPVIARKLLIRFAVFASLGTSAAMLGGCGAKQEEPKATKPSEGTRATTAAPTATTGGFKVLRTMFRAVETGFDPVKVTDLYSNTINEAIFERLVTYDYLARPVKLVPGTVEAMPEVVDEGKTITFKIKKGIHFSDDPVFKGKKRELVAEDYIYSIKRFMDPKNRSGWQFLVEGKIVGLDELLEEAKKTGKFDYDKKVAGLEAVDSHTLRIKLKSTDYNFLNILAMPTFGAVAREVIEAAGDDTNGRPVGTGPYKLKEWQRSAKIVLDRNPNFKRFTWDFQAGTDPRNAEVDKAIVAANKGKLMPAIDQIEVSIMEEPQAQWLAFQKAELDLIEMPRLFAPVALPGGKISAELQGKGVGLSRPVDPEIGYTFFNQLPEIDGKPNPVAGMSKDRIALRRAIALAYNNQEFIDQVRKGEALEAHMIVPLDIPGNDPNYRTSAVYNPELANKLLDKFGFKKGSDGFRNNPDGSPLELHFYSEPDSEKRLYDELWAKTMKSIGIRLNIHKDKFSDLVKRGKQCKLMMRQEAWIADYPDGENFAQLLYGPNSFQSNHTCLQMPEYDALYKKMIAMPDSPDRTKLFIDMTRLIELNGIWKLHDSRYRAMLFYPRVKGYKKHPILHAEWIYLDVDPLPAN